MASNLIRDGSACRIEFPRPWWSPFCAFPLFCGAFYMFIAALMGAREAALGGGGMMAHVSTLLFLICGVVIGVPAMMIACSRHFAADSSRNEVCRIFQIGPFKWRRARKLSDFALVEACFEADSGQDGPGAYYVRLASATGADAMRVVTFDAAQLANGLARDLGAALGLPSKDAPSRYGQRAAQL